MGAAQQDRLLLSTEGSYLQPMHNLLAYKYDMNGTYELAANVPGIFRHPNTPAQGNLSSRPEVFNCLWYSSDAAVQNLADAIALRDGDAPATARAIAQLRMQGKHDETSAYIQKLAISAIAVSRDTAIATDLAGADLETLRTIFVALGQLGIQGQASIQALTNAPQLDRYVYALAAVITMADEDEEDEEDDEDEEDE